MMSHGINRSIEIEPVLSLHNKQNCAKTKSLHLKSPCHSNYVQTANAATRIFHLTLARLTFAHSNAPSAWRARRKSLVSCVQIVAVNSCGGRFVRLQS